MHLGVPGLQALQKALQGGRAKPSGVRKVSGQLVPLELLRLPTLHRPVQA